MPLGMADLSTTGSVSLVIKGAVARAFNQYEKHHSLCIHKTSYVFSVFNKSFLTSKVFTEKVCDILHSSHGVCGWQSQIKMNVQLMGA